MATSALVDVRRVAPATRTTSGGNHVKFRSTRPRAVAVVLALALAATACGSGRSASSDDGNGGGTATTAAETSTDFGTLASPCGPAEGTNGATDQGVTADSIAVGYGDDAGYQGSPGLNHQISDAMKAMIDWCNEQGGVNGRTVVGHYYDAKITETANVVAEACKQDFMLVGSGWALAAGGETARLGCKLPAVPALVGGSELGMAPLMVTPVPTVIDYNVVQVASALAKAYPEQVKKAAVMVPPLPASVETIEKVENTYPDEGWTFLDECKQQYALTGEADWKPFVQKLKECGAEVVVFSGGNPNFQNVLDAAAQIEYDPIWLVESNFYDQAFADWNSSGNADNVYLRFAFVPFGQAEPGSATEAYLDLVKDHGGDTSLLGAQAASAFLLWATAAKQCGADLTRDCAMEKLKAIHSWTGGGLHADMDPGGNLPAPCGLVLKMEGTKFIQWDPATENEFACDPSYLVKVDPPVEAQAALNLGPDRITTKNGTGQ
jgi:ABC-type branched-subunit amino acid transport system substrate-binding protein